MSVFGKIQAQTHFNAPDNWLRIKTIDMHTGGEPLRVVVSGFPKLKGDSVLGYRRYVKNNYDYLRKALMFEPRGHADMYGCILTPPNSPDADFGILFMHNEGYSTMCGHAIIAITKLAVIMAWVEIKEPLTKIEIDAPCGRITSFARIKNRSVDSVYFHCVPSFVVALDLEVEVKGLGIVQYDLAFGGAYYAYVSADLYKISMDEENYQQLIKKGMAIKRTIMASRQKIDHPFEKELGFLYGTIFTGAAHTTGIDSRNVCIFAEGEVDRSPTGSGVAGRMAIHHKRGDLKIGETMTIESIVGSVFTGSVVRTENFGPFEAVIPQVEGTAYVTGMHEFVIDPDDPFKEGFIFR